MAVKKDGTGRRWVEMEILVPGTPEQVWQAMATGAGNTAWFTRTEIEERVGGRLQFEFAPGMSSSGQVTFWEPPHCFGYVEREWSEGAPPVATEITITSRSDDRCVVRMVHSLFAASDDWDGELEGFESGWPGFFEILHLYLGHYSGMPAASFQAMAMDVDGDALETWSRLTDALGLSGANAGEQRTITLSPETLAGVVESVHQTAQVRSVLLRLDRPGPGAALIGIFVSPRGVNVSMSVYFYGNDAAQRAETGRGWWSDWLAGTFSAQP